MKFAQIKAVGGRRIFLLIFVVLQLISGAVLFYDTAIEVKDKRRTLMENNQKCLSICHQFIGDYFDPLITDINYFTKFKSLNAFMTNPNDSVAMDLLNYDIEHFALSNPKYSQVRVLDTLGNEIIRVNQKDGHIRFQAKNTLQNKSSRPYFVETMKLPQGRAYISPMDLNVENGVLEWPRNPVIRAAMPLYINDQKIGMVIINYSTSYFLSHLKSEDVYNHVTLSVFNSEGYYLIAPDENHMSFGLSYEDSSATASIQKEYPKEWMMMNSSSDTSIISENGLFSYTWVRPYQTEVGMVSSNGGSSIKWGILCHIDEGAYAGIMFPFYQSFWVGFVLLFIANGALAYLITMFRVKELLSHEEMQDLNLNLEYRVQLRTRQISKIKSVLETQVKEMNDSLNYAKRVQEVILPETSFIKQYIPESFIIYLPKHVVSGDFYWAKKIEDNGVEKILCAVGDATGHGVPGAMVSIICTDVLNEIVADKKVYEPSKILDLATSMLEKAFVRKDTSLQEGMDISLCLIDPSERKVIWAGANNPLWIVREGEEEHELIELKGNKQPVGTYYRKMPFDQHEVQLLPNDTLYMFSDGYQDQFGGPFNKKITRHKFKQLIRKIAGISDMKKQKEYLLYYYDEWKADHEQIDDVCLMGIKV